MGLPTTYTQAYGQLGEFFSKIRDAQAPAKFTLTQLKDFGYSSNNHRPFIPLLKALGFLSSDGSPTQRYHDYRSHSMSKNVMGQAIKDAYSDIFLIKAKPTSGDKPLIEGKFKSFHNASDIVAGLMTKTFYSLLDLADLNIESQTTQQSTNPQIDDTEPDTTTIRQKVHAPVGLHYNIQIHLPATKDVEVYNAIFKSLKDHLLE